VIVDVNHHDHVNGDGRGSAISTVTGGLGHFNGDGGLGHFDDPDRALM
jgi:hypothetical protein